MTMLMVMMGLSSFAMDCKNIGSRCIEESEKVIDGFRVTKCWKYEDSFECKYPSKDNCKPLRDEGCLHVTHDKDGNEVDACLLEHQGKCLNFKKHYVCEREREVEDEKTNIKLSFKERQRKTKCSGRIPCSGGDCGVGGLEDRERQNAKDNSSDMLDAITQMTALNDMAKDFSKDNVSVFKGEAMRCKKNPLLSFRDCCGAKGKGWGTWISRCKADAKAMYERDRAGHCIDLGTYCSSRDPVFKSCLEKKQTYCCFKGKLQKLIHQQGRNGQLKIGFGSAKHPNCRGMTIEELQKLNFDKIEFKDFYDEVAKNYKTPNVAQTSTRIADAFKNIARDFKENKSDTRLKDKTNQIPFRNKKFNEEVIDEKGNIANRPHM